MAKNLILWLVIAVVLMSVFQSFNPGGSSERQMSYSQFVSDVRTKAVREVQVDRTQGVITGIKGNGERFETSAINSKSSLTIVSGLFGDNEELTASVTKISTVLVL